MPRAVRPRAWLLALPLLALAVCVPAAMGAHPKRGVASARFLGRNPATLSRLGADWAYDCSATPPATRRGPRWVPMVWGSGSVTRATVASLQKARKSGRAHRKLFSMLDSLSYVKRYAWF